MRLGFLFVLAPVLLVAPATSQSVPRYWIVPAGGATVEAPPVTPAALARRALRASTVPVERLLAPSAHAMLNALGVVPAVESRWLGAVSAPLTPDQLAAVAALPWVRAVRPVARLQEAGGPVLAPAFAPALPAPPDAGPSLGQLQRIGADALLDAGLTGAGVRLGFLDTLFDFAHPALAHVAADGRLVAVEDFTGGLPQDNYHGLYTTSVALGAADGALYGPAHGATVLAGTTEYAPTETHAEEDYFVAGMEWMEAQGADVVSVSLGYNVFDPGEGDYTYADLDGDTTPFTRVADRAATLGVVVVVSAGNAGDSDWHYITAPADGDSVITVGAVRPDGSHASFSGHGPTADGRIKPDVAAQGTDIVFATTSGGYASFGSGTSFSAPLVAGVVAQLLEARPAMTPMEVRDALRQTATQAGAPDHQLGWGIVQASAALAYATADEPEPDAGWRVFPSVVRAGAHVTAETRGPATLVVTDALGRRVAGAVVAGAGRHALALPRLAPGVYVIAGGGAPQRLVVVR